MAPSRVGGVLAALLAGALAIACSSSDGGQQADAAANDAGAGDAGGGGNSDSGQSPCAPQCTPAQVCCVDEHGHLPRCVEGAQCPLPLQSP